MKLRKIISILLAVVMVLSVSATAFATADITDLNEKAELEVSGTTTGATIKVVVPTAAAVALNPYELTINVPGSESYTASEQVVAPVYKIKNESTLPIIVKMATQGKPENKDVKLVATDTEVTGTDKTVYMALVYSDGVAKATADTYTTQSALSRVGTELVITDTKTADDIQPEVELAAHKADDSAKDILAFTFYGAANKEATTPWSSDDVVTATVVFSFELDTASIS